MKNTKLTPTVEVSASVIARSLRRSNLLMEAHRGFGKAKQIAASLEDSLLAMTVVDWMSRSKSPRPEAGRALAVNAWHVIKGGSKVPIRL